MNFSLSLSTRMFRPQAALRWAGLGAILLATL
jgi:hypothetical protein